MNYILSYQKLSKLVGKLCFFMALSMGVHSYSQQLLRATITSISSTRSNENIKKYTLQQSIGQSGLIGTKNFDNIQVQQGFLTNSTAIHIPNTDTDRIDESLALSISPNPFIDHVRIKFSKQTRHDIYIKIYDINGKLIFSKKQRPTNILYVPMHNYSVGTYLLHIQSGMNRMTKKLLKSRQQ